eukprot:UN00780
MKFSLDPEPNTKSSYTTFIKGQVMTQLCARVIYFQCQINYSFLFVDTKNDEIRNMKDLLGRHMCGCHFRIKSCNLIVSLISNYIPFQSPLISKIFQVSLICVTYL